MQSNFFKWFSLPEDYQINVVVLQEAYYAMSKHYHPDNVQDKSRLEIRLAQQALAYTHQAYDVLSCPIKRAKYILALHYIDLDSEDVTQQAMSPDFLNQIFEWQSQDHQAQLLKIEWEKKLQDRLTQVILLLEKNQFELAALPMRELLFIQKILESS